MPAVKRPRRGSIAFYPRKRAKRIYPSVTTFPVEDKTKVLGFAGYKAGMTHVMILDGTKGSPTFGQELAVPATILDCPPVKVVGIRSYSKISDGVRAEDEALAQDLPKELSRKLKVGKYKTEEKLADMEKSIDKIAKVRIIVATQPSKSGIGKKTPEVFELEVGGKTAKEKLDYAKQLIGKDIAPKDFINEGELVDVISVTTGKGTEGPVTRFGVRMLDRHSKQKIRHVGAIAQQVPRRIRWTARMAGQMGFQTRTEINKRVLKIGEGKEVVPSSGIPRYGVVPGSYILLQGSVPGPKKRLIMLRAAIRPQKVKTLVPDIKSIVK